MVRSDNDPIFQSRRLRAACRHYRLAPKLITPGSPEQNGLIERFFKQPHQALTNPYTAKSRARQLQVAWADASTTACHRR